MSNPLLYPSDLPFGVPDFASLTVENAAEALRLGMQEEAAQWEAIATDTEEPTVLNTIVAIDAAGSLLERAEAYFFVMLSSIGGSEWEALYEELAPMFSEHADKFWMDDRIFNRVLTVSRRSDLDEETRYFADQMVASFRRHGVALSPADQELLREQNQRIATLQAQVDTKITQQLDVTASTGSDLEDLEGLSSSQRDQAKRDGEDAGTAWKLSVANYSQPPLIASLDKHEVRQKTFNESIARGFGAEPDLDTRPLIIELAKLRARRAKLLGFEDHAALAMDDQTVPGPQAARDLLQSVGQAAIKKLDQEKTKYGEQAQALGFDLGPEDWRYFEERARSEVLGLETEELSQYLELDRVIHDGLFYAANRLYGLTFRDRPDIRGWAEEVRAWEVFDEDGRPLGLFLGDYYTRKGKSGGAWMGELQSGSAREGKLPVVTNDANFTKPPEGEPTLLTWDDVETCFHEFGHALHGLLTNTYYSATAGTSVPADFVELPSQLNEMWAYHPEVLQRFAKHHETGEPLPQDVAEKLVAARTFGQAFSTLEYVQAAIIDQDWHVGEESLVTSPSEVGVAENRALANSGVAHDLVVPRYRTPYFAHTFAGGYDGAYYSYMWAEAMVGEIEEWFAEQAQPTESGDDGGLNRDAGAALRREILSRGDARDPLTSFIALRGHAPAGEAVIRRRGLDQYA